MVVPNQAAGRVVKQAPGLSSLGIQLHQKVKGKIGKMSITRTATGKFYVSVFTLQEAEYLPKTGKEVGIDLGLTDFVITSGNRTFENNRYLNKNEKQIRTVQQHLSGKEKGSKGYEKQILKVANIHKKIARCILDALHKASRKLVDAYDTIVCEELHIKGMVKNRKLAKQIADASWGHFIILLQYKCNRYGKKLIEVNRFFPSSKTCNNCGWINQDLKLSDRKWTCNSCGQIHVLDFNASRNILLEGLKTISGGTFDYKGGEEIKHKFEAHSTKPEAHLSLANGAFTSIKRASSTIFRQKK